MKKWIIMDFELDYDGETFKVSLEYSPARKGNLSEVYIDTLDCVTNHVRDMSPMRKDEGLIRAIEDRAADEWYEMTSEAADRCMK